VSGMWCGMVVLSRWSKSRHLLIKLQRNKFQFLFQTATIFHKLVHPLSFRSFSPGKQHVKSRRGRGGHAQFFLKFFKFKQAGYLQIQAGRVEGVGMVLSTYLITNYTHK
jgi:hypothetical protein